MPLRRPTQRDIAAATGLSQTAVSLVLRHGDVPAVSADARARILKAAQRLGYVPNRIAQNLQATRSHTLACIVPDITNPTYPAMVRGFQAVSQAAGYDVMIFDTDAQPERERQALNWLLQGHVDGVLASFFHIAEAELAGLVRRGTALVLIGRPARKTSTQIDRLYVDNAGAARAMTQALIAKKHRHIAMISHPLGPGAERCRGYRSAMKDAGLRTIDIPADGFVQDAGMRAMAEFLAQRPLCSAVFAANDLLAIGAMAAIRAVGLRIPQDIAVAGFDDIPAAALMYPALTTVHRSEPAMGRMAADMLIAQLDAHGAERPGRSIELPYQLVMRDSA
ncbi:LacI family DNA-binding transcriptional regulator [Variovorax sp. PBL-E5]|uniref:LacI family DNA-binding transcriptional regulator n=1 Tax=Variovorax sp. PBL-E5 TaxID=434014 RepID=UPI0013A58E52|nr:LacI family DNA-binding transcriptional regulator [Variovorax sp. PBL-E5]